MKKKLMSLLCLLAALPWLQLHAQDFPAVSSGKNATWYLIRFLDGGNVLSAGADGLAVRTAGATGRGGQLWKIEGGASAGYTLTNKNGLTLCAGTLATETRVRASSSPAGNAVWSIRPSSCKDKGEGFEIHPLADEKFSLNPLGGAIVGLEVGLWEAGIAGNVVTFVPEKEFAATPAPLPLIPYPAQVVRGKGQLRLSALKAITYPTDDVRPLAEELAAQLKTAAGIALTVQRTSGKPLSKAINLDTDAALGKEAYRLTVDGSAVRIAASARAGFFYALQTLRQLMPAAIYGAERDAQAAWMLPCVEIEDAPLLEHRGFMLDVARYFFTKEEVMRTLDLMASYKLNRFHWHLTDDQGWRVQIPEYPKLTEVGAVRDYSLSNRGDGRYFYDEAEYGRGCWYSLDDLREVVAYAQKLNIEIIPEIDMPGHMVAAISAYPELSCHPDRQYSVRVDPGVSTDVLNIGKDEVIDFLKCVLRHVAEIFPGQYIHLGGDECPTKVWVDNPDCQKRIADNHLAGVDELQPWLVEELGCYLKDNYGKDIIVWDELLAHWKDEYRIKPVAMAWRGLKYTRQAADKGFKSIAVPVYPMYFDLMQATLGQVDPEEVYQGGYSDRDVNSLHLVYALDPLEELEGRESYCIGTQANLWTESCADFRQAQYQMLPRMLALSENAWLPAAKKEWNGFYRRLQGHDEMLDARGYVFARHYFEPADRTPAEDALAEAESMLSALQPGAVGHPDAARCESLRSAAAALKARPQDAAALSALHAEISACKAAPVAMPEPGKLYRIVSAATFYKARYAGSAMCVGNGKVRFHYTPRQEPEELWSFEPLAGGYAVKNFANGGSIYLPGYDSCAVVCHERATALAAQPAVKPTGKYDYKPGAMTLSALTGIRGANAFRLCGNYRGNVVAHDNPAICYPGTWRIEEVTDFAPLLSGLCAKCEKILAEARSAGAGQECQDALSFLEKSVLVPARAAVDGGQASRETYLSLAENYRKFLAMKKKPCCGTSCGR